ncbi:MAG: carbohydrate kinase family protein [Bacilli bacterium]|nr:carbohydrate kinase family protein [Bacilli bacterium]
MKILCIGHITYDITFPTYSFPKENTKTRFHEKEECVGGPTAIAAILLSKWNETVEMAGILGNDEYGKKIKKELTLNKVGTKYVILKEEYKTSHSLVLANRENGTRTILTYADNNNHLTPFIPEESPDIILIDGYEYEASKQILKKYPKAISVIDASYNKKETVELARMVNYLICSKDFAEKTTGIKLEFQNKENLLNAFLKMEKTFKNNVIITLEENGCIYRDGEVKIMPSIKVKTVDSTGAGDIFHGAFVYGLAKAFALEKTLKYAVIAGALSVTRVGGYHSIPTLEEMNEVYEQVK